MDGREGERKAGWKGVNHGRGKGEERKSGEDEEWIGWSESRRNGREMEGRAGEM